jgi:hypothetical protein
VDLRLVFAQYLTTPTLPELDYRIEQGVLSYRWAGVVAGFAMPVRVGIPGLPSRWLRPTEAWQRLPVPAPQGTGISVDENFYVTARNLAQPADTSGATSSPEGRVPP